MDATFYEYTSLTVQMDTFYENTSLTPVPSTQRLASIWSSHKDLPFRRHGHVGRYTHTQTYIYKYIYIPGAEFGSTKMKNLQKM